MFVSFASFPLVVSTAPDQIPMAKDVVNQMPVAHTHAAVANQSAAVVANQSLTVRKTSATYNEHAANASSRDISVHKSSFTVPTTNSRKLLVDPVLIAQMYGEASTTVDADIHLAGDKAELCTARGEGMLL